MSEQFEQTASGMIDFSSQANKNKAKSKKDNIVRNIQDNKKRSTQAKFKPKDHKSIAAKIESGKQFVDQFFHGFSEVDRANITADIDDEIPFRVAEVYTDRIQGYVATEVPYENQEEQGQDIFQSLVGGLTLGMAIKLNKSSTESEKQKNFGLSAISQVKIKEPKQAAVILDSLGKTDLPNDNHFRINDQHYAAKRHMVRGTQLIIPDTIMSDYLRDDRGAQFTFKAFKDRLFSPDFFPNMIDDTSTSVDRIRRIGRQVYEQATDQNIEFKVDNEDFLFRLPKFDLPEELTMEHVSVILSNSFFKKFKADKKDLAKAMAGLILGIAKQQWLLNPSKQMKQLDSAFSSTFFENFTFFQIMDFCLVWNVNDYFKTDDLNSLAIDAIHKWNTKTTKTLGLFLDLIEIDFSEHGTEAQLIQIDRTKIQTDHKNFYDKPTYRMKGKLVSKTPLKTSNFSALMGLFTGFTKNIKFKSDFIVNHDKNNRQLLFEFLKKDFKD